MSPRITTQVIKKLNPNSLNWQRLKISNNSFSRRLFVCHKLIWQVRLRSRSNLKAQAFQFNCPCVWRALMSFYFVICFWFLVMGTYNRIKHKLYCYNIFCFRIECKRLGKSYRESNYVCITMVFIFKNTYYFIQNFIVFVKDVFRCRYLKHDNVYT